MADYFSDNPARKAERERINRQSEETKRILDMIGTSEAFNLKEMKRTRPKLAKGDVFKLNPFGEIYFYGIVLNCNFEDDLVSFCILKRYSIGFSTFDCEKEINENEVLVGPYISIKTYWNRGLFNNIGVNVADKINLDYGFYSMPLKTYVDEKENVLNRTPKLKVPYSLTTLIGVGCKLNRELAMNNTFLDESTRREYYEFIEQASKQQLKTEERELTDFEKNIQPFMLNREHARRCSITLTGTELGELQYLFKDAEEGVEGNGYDWENLIKAVIKNKFPEYKKRIKFDPEADMFYMYCSDEQMIKNVITYVVKEIKENALADYIGLVKAE